MATEVDDRDLTKEPGLGLALLTVLGMILTIAVLSMMIWALMIGVTATTAGRSDQSATQAAPLMDQKALPANPPQTPPSNPPAK
jgi:hypothetical protein